VLLCSKNVGAYAQAFAAWKFDNHNIIVIDRCQQSLTKLIQNLHEYAKSSNSKYNLPNQVIRSIFGQLLQQLRELKKNNIVQGDINRNYHKMYKCKNEFSNL